MKLSIKDCIQKESEDENKNKNLDTMNCYNDLPKPFIILYRKHN